MVNRLCTGLAAFVSTVLVFAVLLAYAALRGGSDPQE